MVQYIITPWRDQAELLTVRQQLYPQLTSTANLDFEDDASHDEQSQAVARISVWSQRGNCPHLVESTALLMAATLNDLPGNSAYSVRAAYAAAFGRFVTGLLDSHQTKQHKMSMYAVAQAIDVPATYVELRHQTTHEELPSLLRLRAAAHDALRWIWDRYWVKLEEDEEMVKHDLPPACLVAVQDLVMMDSGAEDHLQELCLTWGEANVLQALSQVGDGLEADVKILLRCVRLEQAVTARTNKQQSLVPVESLSLTSEEQASQIRDGDEQVVTDATLETRPTWAVWEGEWIPKPIGCV